MGRGGEGADDAERAHAAARGHACVSGVDDGGVARVAAAASRGEGGQIAGVEAAAARRHRNAAAAAASMCACVRVRYVMSARERSPPRERAREAQKLK